MLGVFILFIKKSLNGTLLVVCWNVAYFSSISDSNVNVLNFTSLMPFIGNFFTVLAKVLKNKSMSSSSVVLLFKIVSFWAWICSINFFCSTLLFASIANFSCFDLIRPGFVVISSSFFLLFFHQILLLFLRLILLLQVVQLHLMKSFNT